MIYNFIIKNILILTLLIIITILIIIIEIKEYIYIKNGITPHEAIKLINNNNAIVLDFRNEKNFKKAHIINSINLTVNEIDKNKHILNKYKKYIIIIIENKKNEFKIIKPLLERYECKNIMYITHGINSWIKDNLPTCQKE